MRALALTIHDGNEAEMAPFVNLSAAGAYTSGLRVTSWLMSGRLVSRKRVTLDSGGRRNWALPFSLVDFAPLLLDSVRGLYVRKVECYIGN
jgi:hypothetical protein